MKQFQPICIELLNSFTDVELQNFQHFINCPYFNTDKSIINLFITLDKYILHKRPLDEDKSVFIFNNVFKPAKEVEKLNPKQKKHLFAKLSLLKKLAEQFLAIEGLQTQKANYYDVLLEKLLDKNQFRLFEKHIKQNELLSKVQKKDLNFYKHKKVIETHKLDFSLLTASVYKKNNLFDLNYSLDNEYILLKIRHYITLLSSQQVTKVEYDASFVKTINDIVNFDGFNLNPPTIIGKTLIKLLKYQKKTFYFELLHSLEKYSDELTDEDLYYAYTIAVNFGVLKIRQGTMSYSDVFKLYEQMDKRDLFVMYEFVPVPMLKNYISAACRVEEFVKARNIIEKYRPFINKSDRENVCNYNYGVISFYEQNYNEALKYFIRADLGQDANLKVVILKCHYEMDEEYDERTMQIFRSAKKFFKDNKQLTPTRKRSYRNFIQILIYIYKIKFQETKMMLDKVTEKLAAQDVNSDREWLNTKIEKLKSKLVKNT